MSTSAEPTVAMTHSRLPTRISAVFNRLANGANGSCHFLTYLPGVSSSMMSPTNAIDTTGSAGVEAARADPSSLKIRAAKKERRVVFILRCSCRCRLGSSHIATRGLNWGNTDNWYQSVGMQEVQQSAPPELDISPRAARLPVGLLDSKYRS